MYTQRNDIQVRNGNDVVGGLPGQNVAVVITQAKVAWIWLNKTDFETSIEVLDCSATELHKPGSKLLHARLKAAVYLYITRIPVLRHWWLE